MDASLVLHYARERFAEPFSALCSALSHKVYIGRDEHGTELRVGLAGPRMKGPAGHNIKMFWKLEFELKPRSCTEWLPVRDFPISDRVAYASLCRSLVASVGNAGCPGFTVFVIGRSFPAKKLGGLHLNAEIPTGFSRRFEHDEFVLSLWAPPNGWEEALVATVYAELFANGLRYIQHAIRRNWRNRLAFSHEYYASRWLKMAAELLVPQIRDMLAHATCSML